MEILQLSARSKAKPLAQVGRDLGLHPQFAAPDNHSATIALLTRHIDELRLRVGLLEIASRRRWWERLMFWKLR
jgi:hypothetical protein